jgi:branched-subunit amino acid transport protein AzlD
MIEFFTYGEKVAGYDVRVLNEREARAGAGLLFAFGIIALFSSVALSHIIVTKYFLSFFTLDFLIRVINPSYSPSLLIGRFFVQNQTPEYVGATQKRFAWGVGLLLAVPMFYGLVIDFTPTPMKVFICVLCLLLLISESALSICVGCAIYNLVYKNKATNCPGDVCELKRKDKIQTFNLAQKIIAITSSVLILYGVYFFIVKIEDRTAFMQHMSKMMMSEAEMDALEEKKNQQLIKDFEDEEF